MELDTFVDTVKFLLRDSVTVEVDSWDEYAVSVTISSSSSRPREPTDRTAKITFSGAESFMLSLDEGRFFDQESAEDDHDQRLVIEEYAAFARAYVMGDGQILRKRGLFGRAYDELNIQVRGQRFQVTNGPLIGTWRELP